ncbi:MAG: CocE/NonD family hydrolase [Myxococcales bacterium]|nr:CocE/NonD family hydrolase [Myxococcales bacterium]
MKLARTTTAISRCGRALRGAADARALGIARVAIALACAAAPSSASGRVEASPPVYEFSVARDWLPMPDGVRLSVTFLKPRPRSPGETFPVLLDLYPYRKDEYPDAGPTYFARRGYITATVDVRGTGSSEGVLPPREYSEQELDDAVEVIRLLSEMQGANGRVGMWGKSWGGFNSIQVAMRRPPALAAILATEATDDLFPDDVHHMDGAFHLDQFIPFMDNENTIAQTPDYRLDDAYFRNRFDQPPWFLSYAKHQRDGEFWRKNSLRWHTDRIQIPVYLIGGLLDGYRDSVPRMLAYLKAPVRAAIGPYKHDWPDDGVPGPNYEWRHEAVRWWDHWLKDRDTGMMEEPRLALFIREGHGPDRNLQTTPGHWIHAEWPIPGASFRSFYPVEGRRLEARAGAAAREAKAAAPSIALLRYVPSYGIATGLWWGEPTGDMRPDDAGSLVFDSDIVTQPFEIAGFPRVYLRVSADAPLAHWVARLEDVQPDGTVSLVTGKLLNGSQRRSRLEPEALAPGAVYDLEFDLHFTTWTFQPGHRVRLAISNALFPMIWPTPHPMTTALHLGVEQSRIDLPVIPAVERPAPPFRPPEPRDAPTEGRYFESVPWPQGHYVWTRDLVNGTASLEWKGHADFENRGRRIQTWERNAYETHDLRPAASRFSGEGGRRIVIDDRTLEFVSTIDVRSDEKDFHVTIRRTIRENGELIRERTWAESIPRDFN